MGSNKYNILILMTDQHRVDCLGCYGNQIISTPNIDVLAQTGVLFRRAYVQNPICMPSRATILTGLYPRTHGVWDNGCTFSLGAETIPGFLKAKGYATASIGKIHLNPFGPASEPYIRESQKYWDRHPEMKYWHGPYVGFDEVELVSGHVNYAAGHYKHYLKELFPEGIELLKKENASDPPSGAASTWKNAIPAEYHYNHWIAEKTKEYLIRLRDRPFFMQCSFPDPHFPFSAPSPYCDIYSPADMPPPLNREEGSDTMPAHFAHFAKLYAEGQTEDHFREMAAQTYGMIHFVDDCIGSVVAELESLGLREKTIVIFTTDHGELLGDHGLIYKGPYLYQSLVRTPLIISLPPTLKPGTIQALAGHVDLFPTILDILNEERPSYLQGRSLLPLIEGKADKARDSILTEFHHGYGQGLGRFNVKCIHHDKWKFVHYGNRSYGELYNLEDDPNEFYNLYNDPGYREKVKEFEILLLNELIQTEGEWPAAGPYA